VGGIAGMGATVTDCHAIIQLEAVKEKYGAILGSLENATPKNNYYLPTMRDYGAIDGISYSNMAEPLPHDRFFALDDLPGSFRLVNITFVYNDSTQQRYSLPYGTALSAIDFPTLPKIQGHECYWDGPLHLDDAVTFDVTFTAVYPSHIYTLETALTGRDGLPILLLQGEFLYSDTIEAEEMNETGYAASWSFTLPDSATQMTLRCLLPGEFSSEEISVELRHSDGSWKESEATVQGSYLVMPVLQDVNGLRLVHTPASNWTWLLLAAATVLLLILVVLLIIGHKRKKRKQANKC